MVLMGRGGEGGRDEQGGELWVGRKQGEVEKTGKGEVAEGWDGKGRRRREGRWGGKVMEGVLVVGMGVA